MPRQVVSTKWASANQLYEGSGEYVESTVTITVNKRHSAAKCGGVTVVGHNLEIEATKLFWYPTRARCVTVTGHITSITTFNADNHVTKEVHNASRFQMMVPYSQFMDVDFDGTRLDLIYTKTVSGACKKKATVIGMCVAAGIIVIAVVSALSGGTLGVLGLAAFGVVLGGAYRYNMTPRWKP
jgi:hypothetical protein